MLKRLFLAVLLAPLLALAQSYPSPTFNNLTVNGTTSLAGSVTIPSLTVTTPIAQTSGGTGATSIAAPGGAFDTLCSSTIGQAWVRLTNGWGCTSLGYANPVWWGAVGNGVANDTTAVLAADAAATAASVQLNLSRVYLVSGSVTLNSNLISAGGRIKWSNTDTVTINGKIAANDEAGLFDYPATAHIALAQPAHVSVGWLYGPRDGSLDVSRFMNDAIASAPASGREVFVPVGLWSLTAETIQIGMQNFITIRGSNNGIRSNIEYQKSPPVGIGGTTQFPGGGSALQMASGLATGIQLVAPTGSYATYRTSGLELRDFHMSGSSTASVTQNGIQIQGATDGTIMEGLSVINMSGYGIQLQNSDSASLSNLWLNEDQYPLDLSGSSGIRGRLTNSSLGAITGDALALTNQSGWSITNLNIVYGARDIVLTNSGFNTFSGIEMESVWTGMIVVVSGLENVFTGITMRCWPTGSTPTDPLGRTQASYGLVNLSAVSGGGDVSGTIFSGFDISNGISASTTGGAANPVTFNIGQGGDMLIGNGTIRNTASNQKIVVASAVSGLTLSKVSQSSETVVVGSAVVDASYKTIGKPVIASGFGTSPSIVDANSANAFRINVGTGGTATNGTLTMPTVAHTWVCNIQDLTTHSATVFQTLMSASTTSSVTITNYNTSGAAAAWGSGDVLSVSCTGY